MRTSWNYEGLCDLIDRSGLANHKVADATGICNTTLIEYMRGQMTPSQENMLKLADFFAVPLDFLYGRCSEKQAHDILDNYSENYMALRRAPYETYIAAGRPAMSTLGRVQYESPWPYNLVDKIIDDRCDWILTDDHLAALDRAMEILTDQQRDIVLSYYQQNKTLEDIGRKYNVTRERIRQILMRSARKMRTPTFVRALREGLQIAEGTQAAEARIKELNAQIAQLEKKLSRYNITLNEIQEDTPENIPEPPDELSMYIADLGLSVRAHNCLIRAGYNTLGDVINAAKNGKLRNIRNMGVITQAEILAVLREKTGKDYSVANRIYYG